MKNSKRWRLFFCMACMLCIISDTTVVYAADPEGLEAVEEAQKTLQEKQMEHNEAIAEENRIAVEEAIREKTAAQYAAMGLSPAADSNNTDEKTEKPKERPKVSGDHAEDVAASRLRNGNLIFPAIPVRYLIFTAGMKSLKTV